MLEARFLSFLRRYVGLERSDERDGYVLLALFIKRTKNLSCHMQKYAHHGNLIKDAYLRENEYICHFPVTKTKYPKSTIQISFILAHGFRSFSRNPPDSKAKVGAG